MNGKNLIIFDSDDFKIVMVVMVIGLIVFIGGFYLGVHSVEESVKEKYHQKLELFITSLNNQRAMKDTNSTPKQNRDTHDR